MAAALAFVPAGTALLRTCNQKGDTGRVKANADMLRKYGIADRLMIGKQPPISYFSQKTLERALITNSALRLRDHDLRDAHWRLK